MTEQLQILIDNDNGVKGSFIYFLHEEDTFNERTFWDYYNSIITITKRTKGKTLDRKIAGMMFNTYNYILKSFVWHLSGEYCYKMKNFPKNKLALYIERLERAVGGYFQGYLIDEELFDEDLKNPKYQQKVNKRKRN